MPSHIIVVFFFLHSIIYDEMVEMLEGANRNTLQSFRGREIFQSPFQIEAACEHCHHRFINFETTTPGNNTTKRTLENMFMLCFPFW